MANYTKATNFTVKDSLTSGDPNKIVKGTEIDTEFIAIASAISSKADLASPALTGIPTAPTALPTTNTSQLATTAFVQSAIGTALTGIIAMWSGSIGTIPSGWVLCNGSNGTPDLRDKFIIGASQDNPTVAATNVTGSLTVTGGTKDAINVSHSHTVTAATTSLTGSVLGISESFSEGGGTTTGIFTKVGYNVTRTPVGNDPGPGAGFTMDASHSHNMSISTEGSSGTNQNLPPYYALAFIMKTA